MKLDGATKELFVWGLRCGFVTFGPGRGESAEETAAVLDAKVRGSIRGGISNSPQLSQTLVERALADLRDVDGEPLLDNEGSLVFYDPGGAALPHNDLAAFVREAVRAQPHLNGEGLCRLSQG